MLKNLSVCLLLCLAIVATTHPGLAQDEKSRSNDPIVQMQRDGWKIVKDGVLQRERRPGQIESFVFGVPGFQWKLQGLQDHLHTLRVALQADPKPEIRKAIAAQQKEIANTQRMIALARLSDASGEAPIDKITCSLTLSYVADASSLTTAQGVWGSATATFSGTCGFTGTVYATSTSQATVAGGLTTSTLNDGPRSGANVSATSYTSQTGGTTCQSSGYASVTSSSVNPSSYIIQTTNSVCPALATNPTVGINGVSYIGVNYGACVSTTWTASVTGGTPAYTYHWTWNGAAVGTNSSSYTRSDCDTSTLYSYISNTLGLSVTDSVSHSGSATKSVQLEKFGTTTPPCFAPSITQPITLPCN